MVPYSVKKLGGGKWAVGTQYHSWQTHYLFDTEAEAREKCDQLNGKEMTND